jgi:small subunit ribosomal protein S8
MSMNDPIADMLARLKNAQAQQHPQVSMPGSKAKKAVLEVLKTEGYITGFAEQKTQSGHSTLVVDLKYHQGQPVITRLTRVSKPGRRVYSQATEVPMVANGLGVTIVSTSKGVMSDTQARSQNVGGEIICQVF